jgi:hypothetical protein
MLEPFGSLQKQSLSFERAFSLMNHEQDGVQETMAYISFLKGLPLA